jgi:hypothetical protein
LGAKNSNKSNFFDEPYWIDLLYDEDTEEYFYGSIRSWGAFNTDKEEYEPDFCYMGTLMKYSFIENELKSEELLKKR